MRALAVAFLFGVAAALSATPLDDGKAAFARQDWKIASGLFLRFMTENPDSEEAATAGFLRGVSLYQAGDFRASLDAFQKLERTWPRSVYGPRLPYWKGTAALAAGQPAIAERELVVQTKVVQEPFTTRAFLNLALARIALGKTAEAVEALKAFTASSREATLLSQAWAVWADLDRQAGRFDEALARYHSAQEANPGDRWDLWARTQEIDLLAATQRWEQARQALQAAEILFPAEASRWDSRWIPVARSLNDEPRLVRALEGQWNREADPRKRQDLAVNRARIAEEFGAPDASWWLKASQGPDVVTGGAAILRYAYWMEQSNRWSEAALALESWALLKKLIEAPVVEEVRSRAADDRRAGGEGALAAQAWDRLITEAPKSKRMPSWLLSRGTYRLDSGDSTKALVDFSRVIKEFPQAPEALEARYQTGVVYSQRQEPARAEAYFFGLIQDLGSGPLYERALLARGISFVNSGKTDLARGSLQRLLREVPNGVWTGEAWAALGRNALQSGAFEEAASAYGAAERSLVDPKAKADALWNRASALASRPDTVEEASAEYARYAETYPQPPRASEARYRQGAVFLPGRSWQRALEVWSLVVGWVAGETQAQVREGLATVLLRLERPEEGWAQLEILDADRPHPDAWYRWGLVATAQGESTWASQAFQTLLQKYPSSSAAEAALPRAAGALLNSGQPDQALARYADYFGKFGRQPTSAPVARAAATGALAFPETLETLVQAAAGWNLAPEVATEFALAWAQSRLDSDSVAAEGELQTLSRQAPWASQRSEALLQLGKWHLAHARTTEARRALEPAASLGDDVSQFKARWALAHVTQAEGDVTASARQRESAEKSAGPGVPVEFRLQILEEAALVWAGVGKGDDAQRVKKRIASLRS